MNRQEMRNRLKLASRPVHGAEMIRQASLARDAAEWLQGDEKEKMLHIAAELEKGGKDCIAEAEIAIALITSLTGIEREIMTLRYIEGKSWVAISRITHYSRSRATSIELSAVNRLCEEYTE